MPAFLGDGLGWFIGLLGKIGAGVSSFMATSVGIEVGVSAGFGIAAGLYSVGAVVNEFARRGGDGDGQPDYVKRFYKLYQGKLARCIWKIFRKDANLLKRQTLKNAPYIIKNRSMRTLGKPGGPIYGQSRAGDETVGKNGTVRVANDIKDKPYAGALELQMRSYAHELGNKLHRDIIAKGGGKNVNLQTINGTGGTTDGDAGANIENCIFGNMVP